MKLWKNKTHKKIKYEKNILYYILIKYENAINTYKCLDIKNYELIIKYIEYKYTIKILIES